MEFIKPKILTSYLAKNRGTISLLKIISLDLQLKLIISGLIHKLSDQSSKVNTQSSLK